MLLVGISANTFAQYSGGLGTEEAPYQIATAADMQTLANTVAGGTDYAGVYFSVCQDIDLAGVAMQPIGTATTPFKGVFKGGGYTLSNLTLNLPGSDNVGLFGYASSANISNFFLKSVNITGADCVGGIIGYATLNTAVGQVLVTGTITGANKVGGLIGSAEVQVQLETSTNCADVEATGSYVGGILGYAYDNTFFSEIVLVLSPPHKVEHPHLHFFLASLDYIEEIFNILKINML
jgi:hypothetical protein